MKCSNCGMEVDENSRFCGNCGAPIVKDPVFSGEVQVNNDIETKDAASTEPTIQVNQTVEANIDSFQSHNIEGKNNTLKQSSQVPIHPENKKKKKSLNVIIFTVCGVVLGIVAVVLLFAAFNKSTKSSIIVLEKSLNNFVKKSNNSATIKATIKLDDADISGVIKYQKLGNSSYNIETILNKSMLFDEINLFMRIQDENLNLYTKSSLVDMFAGANKDTYEWIYLSIPNINIEEAAAVNDVNLQGLGLEDKIKFIAKENGLNHYELTIDKELLENAKSKVTDEVELGDSLNLIDTAILEETYVMDLYINDYNELEKISIDLSKYLSDSSVSKAILIIEFVDFNNTVVTIPSEALNSTMDLETYINQNTSSIGTIFEDTYEE